LTLARIECDYKRNDTCKSIAGRVDRWRGARVSNLLV